LKTRADVLLVVRGVFESRARARAAIEAGGVFADGRPVAKASELLRDEAFVEAVPAHPWVGRGALKLVQALNLWPVAVDDRIVLDVGASTGGFTEVCLQRGATVVYAVDVGREQLHPSLIANPRVFNMSSTDARALTKALIPRAPDLIVADVSFISLEKALPAALALAADGADLLALVKPQFEVGRANIGKGGIVTDKAAQGAALEAVKAFVASSGWTIHATADSPIEGRDGNREFLLWAQR